MNQQQTLDLTAIDRSIDEIEKSVIIAQAELGDHVPLRELHLLAGRCLTVETALLGMLTEFGDVEEVAECVATAYSRLHSIDYFGNDFRTLCDLAESYAHN